MEKQLTNKEKDLLLLGRDALLKNIDDKIDKCRAFKWICHENLPQHGEGYVANKNVFDIEEKTIKELNQEKERVYNLYNKLLNL